MSEHEPVKVTKRTERIVERLEGHFLDVIALIRGESRTGRLTIDFNQGTPRFMEFDRKKKVEEADR